MNTFRKPTDNKRSDSRQKLQKPTHAKVVKKAEKPAGSPAADVQKKR